jgi:hypothetical protein
MIATRYFGRYNVTIKKGYLDTETNRWYYILQIERFNDENKLEEVKTYYIIGNKDENPQMQLTYTTLMEMWLNKLRFMEVEKIFFMFPNEYKFKMEEPSLVSA